MENTNTNIVGWIVGIVVIIVLALIVWWMWQAGIFGNYNQQTSQNQPQTKGTVVVSVTDAAQSLSAIDAIEMTVNQVQIHSQTQGWITLSDNSQTFNLLDLKAKGKLALAAQTDIPVDTYDQIKLSLGDVVVKKAGSTASAKATTPQKDVVINNNTMVTEGQTTSVTVDVLADKSLYTTAKGEFVFLPAVKVETRSSTQATVDSNGMVDLTGGKVESTVQSGMDVKGNMTDNYTLDTNSANKLEINNGTLDIKGSTSGNASGGTGGGTGGNINANVNTNTNTNLNY